MNFIQELSRIIFNQENVDRAKDYIRSRSIDPNKLRNKCVVTGSNEGLFSRFSNLYPANIFIDSLYVPIVDIINPNNLIGFDVKYLGISSYRTRFHKFKITPDSFMIYFSKNINEIEDEEPILVTEGVMDAFTIKQLGYTAISPLTALNSLKFCLFLYSISNRIYLMYDNDQTGRKATEKIMRNVSFDLDIQKSFKPIIYSGKDPNQVLMGQGPLYLKQMLSSQIGSK